MYRIVVKPQGGLEAQPHLKGAEEYIAVFAGRVEIGVEGRYRLGGDAIRFCADQPHQLPQPGRGGGSAEHGHLLQQIAGKGGGQGQPRRQPEERRAGAGRSPGPRPACH